MTTGKRAKIILQLAWIFVCLGPLAGAQAGKRLWVLTEPDEAIEYDLAGFFPIQTVKIPSQSFKNPDNLAINGKGQILYVPASTGDQQLTDQNAGGQKVWLWNGQKGAFLSRGATHSSTPAGANLSVMEIMPQWALAEDGQRIFLFANVFKKTVKDPNGGENSVDTTFSAWQADLGGEKQAQIAQFAFPPCQCETGACSETCPEADFWWPESGVKDFFIVTHWIQGQVSTTYQASYLYHRSGDKWLANKLMQLTERMLDGAQGGEVVVYALPDGGCCGWDNEGNDQTLLSRGGKSIVLFDEHKRYANPNYDVSFFTSNALLSPGAAFVAMTIATSFQSGMEIRLSDGGRADVKELARIRQAIKESPSVEVLKLEDPPKRIALIPHATVAGWINDKEILLVEEHLLVALDIATGVRRKSHVLVPKESLVHLR